jgi:hypothetical protein
MAGEKKLQDFIVREAKKVGMMVYKFASPGHRGVPDLILIPKDGAVFFIEVKNPNGKGRLSGLQSRTLANINNQGTKAYVVDSKEGALIAIRSHTQTG